MTNPDYYLNSGTLSTGGSEAEKAWEELNEKEGSLEKKRPVDRIHAVLQYTFDRFWVPDGRHLSIASLRDEKRRRELETDGIYLNMPNWEEVSGRINSGETSFWNEFRKQNYLDNLSPSELVLEWAHREGRFPVDARLKDLFDQLNDKGVPFYGDLARQFRALYANRTTEEVLQHGFLAGSGCTDMSTVGAYLMRKAGLPVGVVFGIPEWILSEINRQLTKDGDDKTAQEVYKFTIPNHNFFVIYDEGEKKWKIFDPKWTKNPGFRNFYTSDRRDVDGLPRFSHGKRGMDYVPFTKSGDYIPEIPYHDAEILFLDVGGVSVVRPRTLEDVRPLIRLVRSYTERSNF